MISPFADLLRHLRLAQKLTQAELAERAQLGLDTISALERGTRYAPRRTTIALLADALALSAEDRAALFAARYSGSVATSPVRITPPATASAEKWPIGNYWGAHPDSTLIGRESLLLKLIPCLEAALVGQGRCTIFTGEPGAGKTRLGQEVMLEAQRRGFQVFTGRCEEAWQTIPYAPWTEALTTAYEAAPSELRVQVSQRWSMLEHLLATAQTMAREEAPFQGPHEQIRLHWAVAGFLQALSATVPLTLAFDDLQWADKASLALLEAITRQTRAAPVAILGAMRANTTRVAHPLDRMLERLNHDHLVECITVGRLELKAIAQLVATILVEVPSAELSAEIYHATDGNPFFCAELVRAWRDEDRLIQGADGWVQRADTDAAPPASIRTTIAARVGHLPAQTRTLLDLASVLGHSGRFDDLAALMAQSEAQIDAALEAAISADLLQEASDDRYIFHHILIQQAIYHAIPARQRRRWHHAAAVVIVARADAPARAAEVAQHFLAAAERLQALPHLILAGDQAERLFAHIDAVHNYRQALSIVVALQQATDVAVIREKLGIALDLQGQSDAALAHLEAAADAFAVSGSVTAHLRVVARIGRAHGTRGTVAEGIARLCQTLASIEIATVESDAALARGMAQVESELARLYAWSGRSAEALPQAIQAQAHATLAGDAHLKALAAMIHGAALSNLDRLTESATAIEAAIPLLEAAGDLRNLCDALTNLNWTYGFLGQMDRCRRCIDQGLLVAERLGDPSVIASMLFWRGNNSAMSYNWISARQDLEAAYDMRVSIGTRTYLTESIYVLGWIALYQGRWTEAQPLFARAISLAEQEGQIVDLQFLHFDLAVRELVEGHPQAARALEDALRQRIGSSDFLPIWGPLQAWIALELDEEDHAEAIITASLDRAQSSGNRQNVLESLRVMGLLQVRRQQYAAANDYLMQALAVARSFPHPLCEIQILYALGHCHLAAGATEMARQCWQEGLEIGAHIDEGLWRPHLLAAVAALPAS